MLDASTYLADSSVCIPVLRNQNQLETLPASSLTTIPGIVIST